MNKIKISRKQGLKSHQLLSLVRLFGLFFVIALIVSLSQSAFAQTNEILAVSPDTGEQGTTGLMVTFSLDTDFPPPPPAGVLPDSVMIGTIGGSSISHPGQDTVTAYFDIPAAEPVGLKDCTISFTVPPNVTLTFSLADGFEVTSTNGPPTITQQPQSRTVHVGDEVIFSVSASGTAPLGFQWQKDGVDITGATGTSYTIASTVENDAGDYKCVVSNLFGTVFSDVAVLTIDLSQQLVKAAYPVMDTMQSHCYDDMYEMTCPSSGATYSGQDAQNTGYQPACTISGDLLTVTDATTGLTWQRSADTDNDGDIDADDKLTWTEIQAYPGTLNAINFGGFSDWRVPTIKELYSLMDFRGGDPSGYSGSDPSGLTPFIDKTYFEFGYGDTSAGERLIDAQYATSNLYVGNTYNDGGSTMFGVNFADGRIKGYGMTLFGADKTFFLICVRGTNSYGMNDFVNNGDGTITDRASGLMWAGDDNGTGLIWSDALNYARNFTLGGYTDWRLPNVKELHSILDYSRAPQTTGTAAIDPLFNVSSIVNELNVSDYPCYWSSTTHASYDGVGAWGSYVAFGEAMGYLDLAWRDIHGAGAQRSDPKTGDPADYPTGHGPQGDAIRIYNYVRPVRGGNGPLSVGFDYLPINPDNTSSVDFSGVASGGTSSYGWSWNFGDGKATSSEQNPSHTFGSSGTFTVTLTATDQAGLVTALSQDISVSGSPGPIDDGRNGTQTATLASSSVIPEQIDVSYGTDNCLFSKAVILYGSLSDYTQYAGSAQNDGGNTGSAIIDGTALTNVWFNIIWTENSMAGHPGYAHDGVSELERTWTASGFASITGDDHSVLECL